jgi:hypothetical protein
LFVTFLLFFKDLKDTSPQRLYSQHDLQGLVKWEEWDPGFRACSETNKRCTLSV